MSSIANFRLDYHPPGIHFLDVGVSPTLKTNRNYRWAWSGQVVSEIGDHFNNVAVFSLALANTRSGLGGHRDHVSRAICDDGWAAGLWRDSRPLRPQTHHDCKRPGPRRCGHRIHSRDSPLRYLAALFAQRAADVRLAILRQLASGSLFPPSPTKKSSTPPTRSRKPRNG